MRESFTLTHICKHTINRDLPKLPFQWVSIVKPRGRWHSPDSLRTGFLGGRLASTCDSFSSGALHLHTLAMLPSYIYYSRCQHRLPIRKSTMTSFQQFQMLFYCHLLIQGHSCLVRIVPFAMAHYIQLLFALQLGSWTKQGHDTPVSARQVRSSEASWNLGQELK